MIFMHTSDFSEGRRASDTARMNTHNNRVRISNLLMCTATDPDGNIEVRLDAFKRALAVWQGDALMTPNIERQCPMLLTILRMKGEA
jgi:hypothetical protein